MTSKELTPKELRSVAELLCKMDRVVAVAVSDHYSDTEMERAKVKRPSAKAVKELTTAFERSWFERCTGFAELARLLGDIAAAGSSSGRDMIGVRKLAKALTSAIANNHLAGALGSQEALIRLAANTGDAVAEIEVLAEQLAGGQKTRQATPSPSPDDWVQVKLKMIKQTTTTVTTHCKKHPDRIRWQSDGVYLIRRKYLERYLEGWDLKHCLEKAGSLDNEV
jgi:hypothetical protein